MVGTMVTVVADSSPCLLFPVTWREIENIITSGGGNFQSRAKPKTDDALCRYRGYCWSYIQILWSVRDGFFGRTSVDFW